MEKNLKRYKMIEDYFFTLQLSKEKNQINYILYIHNFRKLLSHVYT